MLLKVIIISNVDCDKMNKFHLETLIFDIDEGLNLDEGGKRWFPQMRRYQPHT